MPSGKRKGWGVDNSQLSSNPQSFNLDESEGFSIGTAKPPPKPVFSGANFLDPSSPEDQVRKQINLPVRYTKIVQPE